MHAAMRSDCCHTSSLVVGGRGHGHMLLEVQHAVVELVDLLLERVALSAGLVALLAQLLDRRALLLHRVCGSAAACRVSTTKKNGTHGVDATQHAPRISRRRASSWSWYSRSSTPPTGPSSLAALALTLVSSLFMRAVMFCQQLAGNVVRVYTTPASTPREQRNAPSGLRPPCRARASPSSASHQHDTRADRSIWSVAWPPRTCKRQSGTARRPPRRARGHLHRLPPVWLPSKGREARDARAPWGRKPSCCCCFWFEAVKVKKWPRKNEASGVCVPHNI